MPQPRTQERLRRYWDKQSASYDKQMGVFDKYLLADTRDWICGRATGATLEVAIGTGLNLGRYSDDVALTGVEWSPAMLAVARGRAARLERPVTLVQGDAQSLDHPDASFDTVVCTFSLCAIPDDQKAVQEMARVLRPGGLLLLADHVEGGPWLVRGIQRLVDLVTIPLGGEHNRRRPIRHVQALGWPVEAHDRFKAGIVERLAARKPAE